MQLIGLLILALRLLPYCSADHSDPPGVENIAEALIFRKYSNLSHTVFLPSAGKGTVGFAIMPLDQALTFFRITAGKHILTVYDREVRLSGPHRTTFKRKNEKTPACSLTHPDKSQYVIWVSISARRPNAFIKVGYGYRMACNVLTSFVASDPIRTAFGLEPSLASITEISIDERVNLASSAELCSLALTLQPSPFLELNRPDIHTNSTTFFPQILDFPPVLQRLHGIVKSFDLADSVLAAINFSLDNSGCLLHSMLQSKPPSFGSPQSTYIRVPLRDSTVTSPGLETVLEIWPKGHSSPIHNHGNCASMIKVLQGTLKLEWYNPLVNVSNEKPQGIQNGTLDTGNITWILPHLFQTHRLMNERHDSAAITIQAYGYVDGSKEVSDVFRYVLPDESVWRHFFTKVDIFYPDLERKVLEEHRNGECRADWIRDRHTLILGELEVQVQQLQVEASSREERIRQLEHTAVSREVRIRQLKQNATALAERVRQLEVNAVTQEEQSRQWEKKATFREKRMRQLEKNATSRDERIRQLEIDASSREEQLRQLEVEGRSREERVRQLEEKAISREDIIRRLEANAGNCTAKFAALMQRIKEVEDYIVSKETG